jgi:signal transduction histidine kinase
MPEDECSRGLRADLAVSEAKLSVRTRERDNVELALVTSERELTEINSEFSDVTANLAILAQKLARRTNQLDESNQKLADRTDELEMSAGALEAMTHEKNCFVAVLLGLKTPVIGSTRILQYVATGKAAIEQQPEILRRLIESNKTLLAETDRLAAVFVELSQRTSQLDESNVDLAERTAELEVANTELRAMKVVMQQREDFVAALTHDLKNPLIGGNRILEHIVEGSVAPEQLSEILSQVIQSNKNMLHLIWNMLEVYKSDSGCLVPEQDAVNIFRLLTQCLSEFSFAIKGKKIELRFDVSDGLTVNTDRSLLRRVLINLLDNGVKFTPEGGQLIVSAVLEQQQLKVSVVNSGPAMSDMQLEGLFERFWQTPQGRQYGLGTGLGLFLSKQIMDVLGGSIECHTIEQNYTAFTITLDAHSTEP